ncbi:MAG: ORF6N domain-containing protein [Candidatus Schekmanbacteria bacterium]|nr:ORF6N domain-containing protein [Candidatus Schekmanbacteria bacterium]
MIPHELIEKRIFFVRGQKIMLDADLAELYQVSTKRLNEQVRRNINRFPPDFMFKLTNKEYEYLRSQIATSKGRGGRRYLPLVFTEQGVAMLSTVLNSERAIQVNIGIMRAFVKLREILATHKDLASKLEKIEKKYDSQFKIVFDAIRQLLQTPPSPKRKIGFETEEESAQYKTKKKRN